MRYLYDHDFHIHSKLSLCSDDAEQTTERILRYAKENHLSAICLTDHFWDETVTGGVTGFYQPQNLEHIRAALLLPQADGIRFLFGCETEMDKDMRLGIAPETFDAFDFVVIPTTHFHMRGFTIPTEAENPEQKADFWLKKLHALLDKDLPFAKIGIAHLTCGLLDKDREKYLRLLSALSESDLTAVFCKAAKRGCGIELNADDMKFSDSEADTVLRMYRIAKECGCKFYLGSDAHHPAELDGAKARFERAIDLLNLTEADKFQLGQQS